MPSDLSVDTLSNGPAGPQFRVMVYFDDTLTNILNTNGKMASLKDLASYGTSVAATSGPNAFGLNADLKLLKAIKEALVAATVQVDAMHFTLAGIRGADLADS